MIAAGKAKGYSLGESVCLAQKFVSASIRDAVQENVPRNEGVEFERQIRILVNPDLSR